MLICRRKVKWLRGREGGGGKGRGADYGVAAGVTKERRPRRDGGSNNGSDPGGGGFAAKGVHRQNGAQQPQLKPGPAQFGHGRVHIGPRQCGESAKLFGMRLAQLGTGIIEGAHQRRGLVQRQAVDAKQTGQGQHLLAHALLQHLLKAP